MLAAESAALKINVLKTKTLRINTTFRNFFVIGASEIEAVSQFRYLGSIVSTNRGSDEDVDNRLVKARQTFG